MLAAGNVATSPAIQRRAPIPAKLSGLFKLNRYKIAYGGRGSGKSWSFARALILLASANTLRIVCFREIQKSIEESVHALLKQQIQNDPDAVSPGLGLGEEWTVQQYSIRHNTNGSEFKFAGLSAETATSMKSYEGFDIAWVEEAESVSETSWSLLIPTIRRTNSEIWISFNPQLDTDYTYKEFVENPPEGAMCVAMNYTDNPWFPPVLEKERLRAKARMSADQYNNIWNGRTRAAVQGAIYAEEISQMRAQGRYGRVPHNPKLHVHLVLDLGWNDSMFINLVQASMGAVCIIEALEVDHTTLDVLSNDLRHGRPYRWGFMFLPHDAMHGDYKTGRTAFDILKYDHNWNCKPVPKVGIEDGIRITRGMLSTVYMDNQRCQPLMDALRRYRRNINKHEEGTGPAHDGASHGGDAMRYTALCAPRMKNPDDARAGSGHNRAVQYPIDEEMGL